MRVVLAGLVAGGESMLESGWMMRLDGLAGVSGTRGILGMTRRYRTVVNCLKHGPSIVYRTMLVGELTLFWSTELVG